MSLPADTHVHSEYSWDTGGPSSRAVGTMERTCAQAVRIGLPTVVFTEHLDVTSWLAGPEDFAEHQRDLIDDQGWMCPPPLDVEGYLASIDRCRRQFPDLQILTGVELGQPHLERPKVEAVVDLSTLDRVNGSLHTLPFRGARAEPTTLYRELADPAEVIWRYLAEVSAMVADGEFDVYTHLDYAARYWPTAEHGPFDYRPFEEGFREALRVIAGSGRALEMNTSRGLRQWIPRWWAEMGGRTVSFGSDDHDSSGLAAGFPEAVALVEQAGFRPGRHPVDLWTRG